MRILYSIWGHVNKKSASWMGVWKGDHEVAK